MRHYVRSVFRARSYEADPYAHLNNGVYLSWFEQGRLDWLESLGFSYDGFAERRQWLVVGRTEVDYRAALHVGDRAVLTSWVDRLGRTSLRFRQTLRRLPEGEPAGADQPLVDGREARGALSCEALTVMVFAADGAAIPIPEDVRAAVEPRLAPAPPE